MVPLDRETIRKVWAAKKMSLVWDCRACVLVKLFISSNANLLYNIVQ